MSSKTNPQQTNSQDWKPVKLAAKVIGHISQGMYRTPAGAIKELISNAYDADASYAKIHTGFPRFENFSCEDDGNGIDQQKFIALMEGGIGDSLKQSSAEKQVGRNDRPIIGRLGVGLLSLAQICPLFRIVSHHAKSESAFEAEIKFPPYSRQEIDRIIADNKGKTKFITHGSYKCHPISYVPSKKGIIVTTSSLRDTFRKTMSSLDEYANKRFHKSTKSYPTFDKFIEAIANRKLSSLYFASPYDQFLFGLALAAPIPYPESDSQDHGWGTIITEIPKLAALQETLKSYDFRVEVDNIELRRPLVLPSDKNEVRASDCIVSKSPKKQTFTLRDGVVKQDASVDKYEISVKGRAERFQLFYFEYSHKVNGYPLEFSGYIFLQTSRLFPKEYQGLLIRLRNVAIGQYDVNVMTYPLAEGPRFSMLSAEVFVKQGLDDALKVDRDGFNTLDPQYIRLQAFVHSILHTLIFPGSWEEEKSRNKQKREKKEKKASSQFSRLLKETTQKAFTKLEIVPRSEARTSTTPVELDRNTGVIRVYQSSTQGKTLLRKKKHRGVAARVIAAFEIANRERSPEKRREIFYKLIGDIFE